MKRPKQLESRVKELKDHIHNVRLSKCNFGNLVPLWWSHDPTELLSVRSIFPSGHDLSVYMTMKNDAVPRLKEEGREQSLSAQYETTFAPPGENVEPQQSSDIGEDIENALALPTHSLTLSQPSEAGQRRTLARAPVLYRQRKLRASQTRKPQFKQANRNERLRFSSETNWIPIPRIISRNEGIPRGRSSEGDSVHHWDAVAKANPADSGAQEAKPNESVDNDIDTDASPHSVGQAFGAWLDGDPLMDLSSTKSNKRDNT